MAFTGVAVLKKVSNNLFRLTGVSLAGAAAGTIGADGSGADVELPPLPDWDNYTIDGQVVGPQDFVKVTVEAADDDVATAIPISVIKTGASMPNFLATLHNDTAATLSPDLEVYIERAGH